MTAKDRYFNLYSFRVTLASIESGLLDASTNAEDTMKNAITSIEEVNGRSKVSCEMQ